MTDSPVNSSNTQNAAHDANTASNQDDIESVMPNVEESIEETNQVSTSKGLAEQNLDESLIQSSDTDDFVMYLDTTLHKEEENQNVVESARMSLDKDSPSHSSSLDEFSKNLEATLIANTPLAEDDENQDENQSVGIKRLKVESIEEMEVSEGLKKQNLGSKDTQTIEATMDANSPSEKDNENQDDVEGARMSLETDSPLHSSSIDEYSKYLEATLDVKANMPSAENDENQSVGIKRLKVESIEEIEVSTSEGHVVENLGSKDTQTIEAGLDANLPTDKDNENQEDVEGARMSIDDTDDIEEFSKYLEATLDIEGANQDDVQSARLKVDSIEETEVSTSEGLAEQNLEASVKVDVCTHPGSFKGLCIRCGEKLDGEYGVAFDYLTFHKGLRLHDQEISQLRNTEMKSLLRHKKLNLVLDLDHTLLNTTMLLELNGEEAYLVHHTDSLEDISKGSLFEMEYMYSMTKLRPFVRTFLKEASKMFEMYIYTMGNRPYALEMAKLLDPEGKYFDSKVISRDDGTEKHQKGLDVLLAQESAILILDDTENAWMKHQDNLILMERYHFFASSVWRYGLKCKSLSELRIDESEPDGALARILKVLKRVHHIFFDELKDLFDRDVRQILKALRSEVLSGCVLVFSRIDHTKLPDLQKMAEKMGAICLTELDPSVTHVVATDVGTEKSRWAVKEQKFLVNPRWLEAAIFFWQKQPEDNYILNQNQQ